MKRVYITREIPEPALSLFKEKGYEVTVGNTVRPPTKKEIIKALRKKPYDAVVTLLTDTIDKDVYDAAPQAKIFANYAVGFNNLDIGEARKRHIAVTNTPGNFNDVIAEHAIALMLALVSNVVSGDRFVRAKKYRGWDPMLFIGRGLSGKKLGIIGAGRIGEATARMAYAGFGMKILYTDVQDNKKLEEDCGAQKSELKDLLKESDVVSVHVPLMPQTTHMVGKEELQMMKNDAYLVNTARGAVLDEKALVEALKEGVIAGAGLDVYEYEPALTRGLARLPNVVLTPHIASATIEARSEMSELVAQNVIAALEGGEIPHDVNS